jgi:hypothetical protein
MKHLLSSVLLVAGWTATSCLAQDVDRPAVAELYTSQGCSSCPPADAMMNMLAQRPDVIVLTLHVDYWDYIGWKDTFASPAHTERQRAYARAAQVNWVFTPQVVVNGTHSFSGADTSLLDMLFAPAGGADGPVLELTRTDDSLSVRAQVATPLAAPGDVHLVRYLPKAKVSIERGENAGKVIEYGNIVTEWTTVATWDGRAPLEMDLAITGDQPAVVLIQAPGPGEILAAARVR